MYSKQIYTKVFVIHMLSDLDLYGRQMSRQFVGIDFQSNQSFDVGHIHQTQKCT